MRSIQLLSGRICRSPTEAEVESAADQARSAVDVFEGLADDDGLAETAIALDNLAYMRGRMAEATWWSSKALRHALAVGRPREATQAAGDLVGIMIVGPLPFDRFAATAGEFLSPEEPMSSASGYALMAVAALALGDDAGFDEHEGRWSDLLERQGMAWLAAAHGMEIAFVEMSVGKAEAAEERIREAREFFAATGNLLYTSVADGSSVKQSESRISRASSSGSPTPSGQPSRSPTGRTSSNASWCSRAPIFSAGPPPKRRPPRGGRSSSWSQPTWCPITRTLCSCSPRSSTRAG